MSLLKNLFIFTLTSSLVAGQLVAQVQPFDPLAGEATAKQAPQAAKTGKKKKKKIPPAWDNERLSRSQLYNKIQKRKMFLDTGMLAVGISTGVAAGAVAFTSMAPLKQKTRNAIAYPTLIASGLTLSIYYFYANGFMSNKGALHHNIDDRYELAARWNGNPFLQRSQLNETQAGFYSGVGYYNYYNKQLLAFLFTDFGLFMLVPKNPKNDPGNVREEVSFLESEQATIIGIGSIIVGAILFIDAQGILRSRVLNQPLLRETIKNTELGFGRDAVTGEETVALRAKRRF